MSDSEDESSDSSCDFLVPAEKINLNSSFFQQKAVSKSNLKSPVKTVETIKSSSSDSDDELEDFKAEDVDNAQSAELFSQILSNLEKEKNLESQRKQEFELKNVANKDGKEESSKTKGLTNEISELLLQGESSKATTSYDQQAEEEEDEEEDEKPENSSEYTIPKEGVLITLPGSSIMQERKKKKTDLETILRNKLNQRIRTTQVLVHKVGLLWWLVHGFLLNRMANDPETLAICLSLITKNDYPKGRVDLVYVQRVTTWFSKTFTIISKTEERLLTTSSLLQRIGERKVYNYRELVLLFVALLRAIGLNCRLVVNICPPPLKPKREQLIPVKKEEGEKEEGEKVDEKQKKGEKSKKGKAQTKKGTKSKSTSKETQKSEKPLLDNSPEGRKNAQIEARKKAAAILKKETTDEKTKKLSKENLKSKANENKSKESENDKSKTSVAKRLRNRVQKESIAVIETDSDFDSDFEPQIKKTEASVKSKKNRKLISSDDEESSEVKKATQDIWVEVYVDSEKSWIPVSIPSAKINCAKEIYEKATTPVLYIVAYNSEGKVKDVTRRYCPHWMTVTRKQRVDENWWAESLNPWKEKDSAISKAEDDLLLKRELELPLPKTMTECKGHPLYALARHLLKFEAIYPPDAVPLGYLKNGEGIYSRYCVHTLRSRETWIKYARVVKPAQEPYKIVKSMPKYDKFSGTKIKGLPLEIFGKWQTDPYVPPAAKDGKVPRNEYGNVYLFKMSMLPKGTVHIDLPGLNRVAKKMDIDCVPAVVGFNFSGCGSHPAFEGYVICEEYEDVLRNAWEEEQIQAEKRSIEKREKRIYGNWRKLISGLLIKLRLAAKYSTNQHDESDDSDEERVAIIRNKLQSKRKSNSMDETVEKGGKIIKKLKVTKSDKSVKKGQIKNEAKLFKTQMSKEVATSSKPLKRKISRKRKDHDDEDDEESESDFEPNISEKEIKVVRSSKRSAAKKQIIYDDDDDDDFEENNPDPEIEEPKKEAKSQKSVKPSKRINATRKRIIHKDDESEKSDSDFEVEKPKSKSKSQKSLKLSAGKKQTVSDNDNSDFEVEKPKKVTRSQKKV